MKDYEMPLEEHWQKAWSALHATPVPALLSTLLASYGEPHRSYHNILHLRECLACLDELASLATRPAEITLALFFHDAIYDTTAKDNEARSADWALSSLLMNGIHPASVGRVHSLVMATRHGADASTGDAAVIIDADLGILGAPRDRFDEYERQIREEYAWVPEDVFRVERRKVLEGFLGREWIYQTPLFRETREAMARENLGRSCGSVE